VGRPRRASRYARRLNIARGTVQSRIDKFEASGVIVGWRPRIDSQALGFAVTAYVQVQVAQGAADEAIRELATVPEMLEAHTVAGDADLLCRVIARDHAHFEEVLQAILIASGVRRVRSEIVLSRRIAPRIVPLFDKLRSEL
jgi:DNA-binding Lrp family transcriptional regulator